MATPIKADEKPEAVEVSVETDLAKHGLPCLVGFIDLVRSGGLIVDFKVASKTPDSDKVAHTNETQLVCYSLLYRDATGKKEAGLELHHLIRTKAPKLIITSLPPVSQQQETRLFRQIESYQRGLQQADFVPSPGFHCSACEYFNECRAWHG
jgi:putative RecB family exonuclease